MKLVEIARAMTSRIGPYTAVRKTGSKILRANVTRGLCGLRRHSLYSWKPTLPMPNPNVAIALCQNVSIPPYITGAI